MSESAQAPSSKAGQAARILLVTNIFPPQIGGPATFIDRLGHALAGRGHRVTVVCTSSGPSDPDDAARPFRVRRVSFANRYLYEVNVRRVLTQAFVGHRNIVVNGLEAYVADVVRVVPRRYILKIVGDSVWEMARNYGVTIQTFEAFQERGEIPPLVAGIAAQRRRYLARATTVVTPSRYLEGVVRRWPGVPTDLITIHNGVALGDYPERTLVPRGGRPLRALFVGRLTNWKGVETLLIAARDLDGVAVDVVGDGPELPLLSGLNAQLGGPATFHGRRSEAEVRRLMQAADVLVLGSAYEGLSHTLLEGSAAGLVPVVSAIGGNTEVVTDGKDGLVVPYADPAALAAALRRLVGDDAARMRLAAAARANAARFPFAETVDAFTKLIEARL